tara:strand:+ start:187 stop:717 length:531 start_codon:yes stop_codon:yes gene_type:complete
MTNPFISIASDIKLIGIDLDGVLSDGNIYMDSNGKQFKKFNSKDGIGIKLLQNYGFKIALISGSINNVINERAISLDIDIVLKGVENKLYAIHQVQKKLDIKANETIFLGDDINDLLVLPSVRMFLSPSNAHIACLKKADWVGKCRGGEGFIREFTDLFLSGLNIDPFQPFETSNK